MVSRRFLACRLADDYGYQTIVRPRAIAKAEALGADQFALGDKAAELEEYVRQLLKPFPQGVFPRVLRNNARRTRGRDEGDPAVAAAVRSGSGFPAHGLVVSEGQATSTNPDARV